VCDERIKFYFSLSSGLSGDLETVSHHCEYRTTKPAPSANSTSAVPAFFSRVPSHNFMCSIGESVQRIGCTKFPSTFSKKRKDICSLVTFIVPFSFRYALTWAGLLNVEPSTIKLPYQCCTAPDAHAFNIR